MLLEDCAPPRRDGREQKRGAGYSCVGVQRCQALQVKQAIKRTAQTSPTIRRPFVLDSTADTAQYCIAESSILMTA